MAKPSAPLSEKRYLALLRDIQRLVETAEVSAHDQKVSAYWKVGDRILRERIVQNAGYHNSVLRDLADDSRITVRTLQRAVLFHSAYPKPPTPQGLSSSHYFILATIASAKDRARFEKLARKDRLTARQLLAAINIAMASDDGETAALPRPAEPAYLYAASVLSIVDGDTLVLDIDLGFHISRKQRIRLASIDAPPRDTPEGRKSSSFVARCLLPAQTVVVQTRRADLHGRYVGHLFYSRSQLSIDDCFADGRYLNAQIVAQGHARPSV